MAKEIVSKEFINALVKNRLEKFSECEGVTLGGVYWHETDGNGCNWDINTISNDFAMCAGSIAPYVRELMSQYNIPDER